MGGLESTSVEGRERQQDKVEEKKLSCDSVKGSQMVILGSTEVGISSNCPEAGEQFKLMTISYLVKLS